MNKILLLTIISVLIVTVSITSISAQIFPTYPAQPEIPAWVKGVANFWAEGNISDSEFGDSISFLIEQGIIRVEMPATNDYEQTSKIRDLVVENKKLEAKNKKLESENKKLKQNNVELNDLLEDFLGTNTQGTNTNSDYLDNGCLVGYPYIWSDGKCHETSEPDCPSNKPYYWSDGFCYNSPEYLENGCHSNYPYYWPDGKCHTAPQSNYTPPTDITPSCDPSYPDVCIAPYPPDLDCDEIYYSNFRVTGSDPHGFDTDYDGIGCEVGSPDTSNQVDTPKCDPSYPDVCIAPYPPDLNCGDIGYSNFRVIGNDPHGFDRDNDGVGCES